MTLKQIEEITPENLRPFSKNPTICKFMIQLGRFDELGSGVTNINKYLPRYAKGAKPVFKETLHGFELTIPLATQHETRQVTNKNPASNQQGAGQTSPTDGTKSALSGHQVKGKQFLGTL